MASGCVLGSPAIMKLIPFFSCWGGNSRQIGRFIKENSSRSEFFANGTNSPRKLVLQIEKEISEGEIEFASVIYDLLTHGGISKIGEILKKFCCYGCSDSYLNS